jgi:hypothetical protein
LPNDLRKLMAYADVESLKGWLDLPETEDEDAKLELALEAASQAIDDYCHRTFNQEGEATHRYVVPTGTTGVIFTPDIADPDSVELALDTVGEGDFDLPITGFTVRQGAPVRQLHIYQVPLLPTYVVRVTAKFGWPEVPKPVEQACLLLAARLFKRHMSPEGITASVNDFGPIRIGSRDFDVEALLKAYKLRGWA